MTTITESVEIDASPAEVWAVLTDTGSYHEWNPFITRFVGDLTAGGRLEVRIQPPGRKPMTFRPTVTAVEPGSTLAWLGRLGVPGLFDGAHSFTLEPLEDGRTRLVQSERFSGVLVWVTRGMLRDTAAGFRAMNTALQRRVLRQPVEDEG